MALLARCYVFGDEAGQQVGNVKRAWETAVLKAHGHTPEWTAGNALAPMSRAALDVIDLHFHDLRTRSRESVARGRLAASSRPAHARPREREPNEHVPQRDEGRVTREYAAVGRRAMQSRCKYAANRPSACSQRKRSRNR